MDVYLPILRGTVLPETLDTEEESGAFQVDSILWDTGAHTTHISEDLFAPEFRKALRSEENMTANRMGLTGIKCMVSICLKLTNCKFDFSVHFRNRRLIVDILGPGRAIPLDLSVCRGREGRVITKTSCRRQLFSIVRLMIAKILRSRIYLLLDDEKEPS